MYRQRHSTVFNLIMDDTYMTGSNGAFAFGFTQGVSFSFDNLEFADFIRDTGVAWSKFEKLDELCPKLPESY